jgi:hypothetical protein
MADAHAMLSTNFAFATVNTSEAIVALQGDPMLMPVRFARSLGQVEATPDLNGVDFAAEKVIVTGQRQRNLSLFTFKLLKNEQQTHDTEGRQLKLVVPTYKKKADLYPDLFRDEDGNPLDSSDVLAENKTVEYRYWQLQTEFWTLPFFTIAGTETNFPPLTELGYQAGELVETITTIEKTKGEMFPDQYPGNTELLRTDQIVERDYCKLQYLLRDLNEGKTELADTVSMDLVKAEAISAGRIEPDGTVKNQKGKDGNPLKLEKKPVKEPTVNAPDLPVIMETLKGEYNLAHVGWTPFRPKPLVKNVGFLPSQGHADNLAKQIALREVRLRDAQLITMPLPLEWAAAGFPPLARCQIHTWDLAIENPTIILAEDQLSFSFRGGLIGTIAAIPDPPSPLPYIPTSALAIAPPIPIRTLVGVAI